VLFAGIVFFGSILNTSLVSLSPESSLSDETRVKIVNGGEQYLPP
jgi:hypothetical protein